MSRERSPGARGRAFGRAHPDAVRNTVTSYRRLLKEAAGVDPADLPALGARVGETVAARWPDLVDELDGMASACGESVEELLAINARTELMAGARGDDRPRGGGECSLIGVLDGDRVRLAQNWDWHPALAPSRVVWTVEDATRSFTTVTEAGILAKLGVSSVGLACGLNFLTTTLDGGVDGVPIHVLLRVVLDRCRTLTDALALLLQAPVAASSCVTLAAAEEDGAALVAVELSPAGAALTWPDRDGLLVHTNHFLEPPPAGRDTGPAEHPSTLLRRARLQQLVRGGAELEAALRSHFPAPEAVCRHENPDDPWPDRRATLLSLVADPGTGSLRVSDGPPCESRYTEIG